MKTETKTKHTPGPWIAQEQKDGSIDIEGFRGVYVARLSEVTDEAIDNARLIAAAPDGLDFIKAMLADAEEGNFALDLFCEGARAFIQKAEGR